MQFEKLETILNLNCKIKHQTKLNDFETIFKIYNSHTNLVSKNDEKFLFEKHIFDSLAINLFLQKYKIDPKFKMLDIGTGGGFPSIPAAIFYENAEIFPIDSIAKKIGFVEMAKKELQLNNLFPVCGRVENFEDKESFDIAVSRAVAPLNIILEYAIPFLKINGYFVAYKSKNSREEIEQAKNALSILNAELVEIIGYSLPLEKNFTRELVVIKKTGQTNNKYPRKTQTIKKLPL